LAGAVQRQLSWMEWPPPWHSADCTASLQACQLWQADADLGSKRGLSGECRLQFRSVAVALTFGRKAV
jgi:hypothetical protein